ncbi:MULTISPECIES: inorganic diphosphatase [Candidatus Nitrosocaldus]|jgi:inorganic pyrophosphatase|uniref:Inorganic pyrophosphatase n=1 Tax=Candidatus Nitrosocaldus cavascurensis TaxID=2058097 RepID=A0A2K5APL6_9ARCH|nr:MULTISPECIES: inorganic diphosphatase [Candidatus Nitrosocaldus]SPC33598.1 Inorganic pyrophosphatase [Candidatus Nitrosocaldus cavascurensis]
MHLWHDIEPGEHIPEIVNVIVEIPKGSQNKYEYDKDKNIVKLDRVLFSPLHYPGDYGLIPRTLAEDGDPLDALVLVSNPTYPGVLIQARPIGLLRMVDSGMKDDKILCVAKDDPRYEGYKSMMDMEEHVLKEIAHFFQVYKQLEGKEVEVIGWKDADEAKQVILNAIENYRKGLIEKR